METPANFPLVQLKTELEDSSSNSDNADDVADMMDVSDEQKVALLSREENPYSSEIVPSLRSELDSVSVTVKGEPHSSVPVTSDISDEQNFAVVLRDSQGESAFPISRNSVSDEGKFAFVSRNFPERLLPNENSSAVAMPSSSENEFESVPLTLKSEQNSAFPSISNSSHISKSDEGKFALVSKDLQGEPFPIINSSEATKPSSSKMFKSFSRTLGEQNSTLPIPSHSGSDNEKYGFVLKDLQGQPLHKVNYSQIAPSSSTSEFKSFSFDKTHSEVPVSSRNVSSETSETFLKMECESDVSSSDYSDEDSESFQTNFAKIRPRDSSINDASRSRIVDSGTAGPGDEFMIMKCETGSETEPESCEEQNSLKARGNRKRKNTSQVRMPQLARPGSHRFVWQHFHEMPYAFQAYAAYHMYGGTFPNPAFLNYQFGAPGAPGLEKRSADGSLVQNEGETMAEGATLNEIGENGDQRGLLKVDAEDTLHGKSIAEPSTSEMSHPSTSVQLPNQPSSSDTPGMLMPNLPPGVSPEDLKNCLQNPPPGFKETMRKLTQKWKRKQREKRYTKRHKCQLCDKLFRWQSQRDEHERSHSGVRPFKCDKCEKTFLVNRELVRHQVVHGDDLPNKCRFCNKGFARRDNCIVHERIHTGEKPFECSICSSRFSSKHGLNVHLRTHTDEKPFQCTFCDKAFRQRINQIHHERSSHTGDKPHKCQFCEKAFANKRCLVRHEGVHTGNLPFKCSYCDKGLCSKTDLERHIMTHTGERPFICSFCAKAFTTNGLLARHERTHSDVRPYPCGECDLAFKSSGDLSRHRFVHAEKKPFQCDLCGRAFIRKRSYNRHLKVHAKKDFHCTYCGKSFKQQARHAKHEKTCDRIGEGMFASPEKGDSMFVRPEKS